MRSATPQSEDELPTHWEIFQSLNIDTPQHWRQTSSALELICTDLDFSEFLNHNIFTVTQLPADAQSLFQQCFRFVLYYVDSLTAGTPLYHRFFQLLSYLPTLLLSVPPNLHQSIMTDIVKKKCRKFLDGKLKKLYSDTQKFARKILPVRELDVHRNQLSAIKRAEQCALAGN